MLLRRTRRRLKGKLKELLFDAGNMQEIVAIRRRRKVEDCMGFRGQWDEHRRFQLAFLKEQGLCPQHSLLEIGCGPLTAGGAIIEFLEPGNYTGIDIRASALDLAWEEVGSSALGVKNPRLICSSSFGSTELGSEKFNFILSFSVLFHLSDEILSAYFTAVAQRLKPGGGCFAQVNTTQSDSTWLQFPFLRRTVEQYSQMAASTGLHTKNLGPIERLGFRLQGAERGNEMLLFQHFPED